MTGQDHAGPSVPWGRVVREVLGGHTCLWQDLDGMHVKAAPAEPPPTSILWAWAPDGSMVRVRLDGNAAYVATCPADVVTTAVVPWAGNDSRVHAYRAADTSGAGVGLLLEHYVDDGLDTGTGPVTFLRARAVR